MMYSLCAGYTTKYLSIFFSVQTLGQYYEQLPKLYVRSQRKLGGVIRYSALCLIFQKVFPSSFPFRNLENVAFKTLITFVEKLLKKDVVYVSDFYYSFLFRTTQGACINMG